MRKDIHDAYYLDKIPYSKRIIITVTNDLNQDQRMHRICNSFQDFGYEVNLVGRRKKDSLPLNELVFKQNRLKCFFQTGFLFYLEYNIRLFFYLMNNEADLLYSVDLDTIGSVGLVSRLKSTKHIHDAHEYFVEVPELQGQSFKKWIWNRLANSFYTRCDLRMTVNEELADVLSDRYKVHFEVLKSAPALNDNIQSNKNKSKTIIYQGVLNQGRGLEEAIKAIASMSEDVELHIAGEGDLSDELRSLKSKVDVNNKVKFLGWLSGSELKALTASAWLGLNLLSSDSLNYKYSLANKFFDYMHAGVPSVNMDFPVYRRIIAEDRVGLCITELNEESIKQAIKELINSPDDYTNMVSECKVARLKYNWEKESEKLKSYLSKIEQV